MRLNISFDKRFILSFFMVSLFAFLSVNNTTFAELPEEKIKSLLFSSDAIPYNITLPEWTAKWWQWAFSFSGYYNNPLLDANGTSVMKYQPKDEPIFFLSGAYNSVANRTIIIPTDKAILFPVLNAEISFLDFPNAKGEDDLKKALKMDLGAATYVGAELNGISIPYQRLQADLFDIHYAKDNIFVSKSGPTQAVADGYWVLLKPLPIGNYTLHLKGEQPFYRSEVTYQINIVNREKVQ